MKTFYRRLPVLLLLLLGLTAQLARAQGPLSGVVRDEKKEALPGVSVVVQGTTRGTSTDADGPVHPSRLVPGEVLTFSLVGARGAAGDGGRPADY